MDTKSQVRPHELLQLRQFYAALGDQVKVRSVLMDRATLLTFRDAWVVEETQSVAEVPWLTADERALYDELVKNHHGR